jgi:NADPH:quinone reductase
MRAMIINEFGPPETLRLTDLPTPEPGPGEVLIEVHASPVNYVDLLVIGGGYQVRPALPFIPGKGPAGVVTALGPNVTAPGVGDRVLAMAEEGGYAEAVAVGAEQCHLLPPRMSFKEAASLSLTYDTAWFALRERARLGQGETVLVLGASGGVGWASVQLARAMGARVLAGVSRPEKATAMPAAGADAVIDLSRGNLRDALREQVWAVTDGRGADVILDPLGGDIFDAAMRALAWCGRLVVIGFAAGRIPTIRTNYLLVKNIEISGLQVSDYRKRRPAQMAACFREIFDLYEKGAIRPAPTTLFPLDRTGEALTLLHDRRLEGRAVLALRDE